MNIIFRQCHNSNYAPGRSGGIKFITLHFTGNNGDTAKNNADYFANNANLKASAHYFVDENIIYQSVKDSDTAWHCGGGLQGAGGAAFYQKCMNSNSFGLELCSRKDANGRYYIKPETVKNAIELTKYLMQKYNVPITNIIRHYDVTGKVCPEPFVREPKLWGDFKLNLESEDLTMSQYEELKKAIDEVNKTLNVITPQYQYIDDYMPKWARPTIKKLYDKGLIKGDDEGKLNLSYADLRMFVINDRTGIYGE